MVAVDYLSVTDKTAVLRFVKHGHSRDYTLVVTRGSDLESWWTCSLICVRLHRGHAPDHLMFVCEWGSLTAISYERPLGTALRWLARAHDLRDATRVFIRRITLQ